MTHLTKEFVRWNLSSVIIVIDNISAAFDFIEELFYSKSMDFLFYSYWMAHPRTLTGAQLLMVLAAHYDFEKRGLEYLLDAYDDAVRLTKQKYYKANVFNKKAKAYIVSEIHDELMGEFRNKGYKTAEEVLQHYIDEQIKIYNRVIDMGGEAGNKALYALGRLHWEEEDFERAIETWKRISGTFSSRTFSQISRVMRQRSEMDEKIAQIHSVFLWEADRNSRELLERLIKYHKWKIRDKRAIKRTLM